ncbi:pyridoxal phosphate-dependent decarboxylase family protein, partial [Candidatus Zixiibacteriota bacterium]
PLGVVATVGTTSSTSIDPVPEIADICGEHRLWLHVDAAYGGVAAIVPEKRDIFAGCERADSLVVNPHKWLFTPVDCSTFYTRHPEVMKAAFSLVPEYLSSDRDDDEALTNLMDYGIQLGRRFRALKLWMVLSYFGSEGLAERLRFHMRLASDLSATIEEQPGVELMAPVNFATVCFRFIPEGAGDEEDDREERIEQFNSEIMNRANASGEVFLSHTKLKGRYTLRLVIGHLRSSEQDVTEVWNLLTRLADELD